MGVFDMLVIAGGVVGPLVVNEAMKPAMPAVIDVDPEINDVDEEENQADDLS